MKPWWQSIHREETGTAAKHLLKQHNGKAFARANAAKHPRAGGITRSGAQATMVAKHPPGPTRQSIRGHGASRARRSPSDNGGKTSTGRGHHAHGGAQATTAATPYIRTGQTKAKIKPKHTQVPTNSGERRPAAGPTHGHDREPPLAAHVGKTLAIGAGHDRGWRKGGGGCSNRTFRKEMTPTDANFVESATQRNFHSQNLPRQPPPTKRARDDTSKKVMTLVRHRRWSKA
jgi:hypothetical protein